MSNFAAAMIALAVLWTPASVAAVLFALSASRRVAYYNREQVLDDTLRAGMRMGAAAERHRLMCLLTEPDESPRPRGALRAVPEQR